MYSLKIEKLWKMSIYKGMKRESRTRVGFFFGVTSVKLLVFVALGRPLRLICEESETWDTEVTGNKEFIIIRLPFNLICYSKSLFRSYRRIHYVFKI